MKYGLYLSSILILINSSDGLNCKRDQSILVNPELQLKLKLFCDYEPGVLPERNISVHFDFTPVHFWYSSTWDNTRIKFECNLTYTDKNLKWSPADYNNIEVITVDGVEDIVLWSPKIAFDEALDEGNTLSKCATVGCTIRSNGTVFCEFVCSLIVWCDISLRRWPFDRQYCTVHAISHYGEGEIILTSTPFDEKTLKYIKSPDWEVTLTDYGMYYQEETQFPSDWNITKANKLNFRMERHSSHYVNTIFAPLLIFTVINILIFSTDLRSVTRILLILLSILSHISYMPYLTWIIPKYKDHLSGVELYFIDSLTLSLLLLIETAILRMIGKSNDGPQSGFVRQMLTVVDDNLFGKFFLLEPEFSDVRADFPILRAIKIDHKSLANLKWWQFVKIVDRFCLLLFLGFYTFGFIMGIRYTIL